MCTGEHDHIGTLGTVKQCPSRAEVKFKSKERKDEEEQARTERMQLDDTQREIYRKQARDKLEAKQREELDRLRAEGVDVGDDAVDGQDGATKDEEAAANAKEIHRRAIAAADKEFNPYEILELEIDTTMTQIRKTYRKLSLQLHPDKVKDMELKNLASIAFMDIVAA